MAFIQTSPLTAYPKCRARRPYPKPGKANKWRIGKWQLPFLAPPVFVVTMGAITSVRLCFSSNCSKIGHPPIALTRQVLVHWATKWSGRVFWWFKPASMPGKPIADQCPMRVLLVAGRHYTVGLQAFNWVVVNRRLGRWLRIAEFKMAKAIVTVKKAGPLI